MFSIKDGLLPKGKAWMLLYGALLALSAPGFGLWFFAWIALIPALHWVRKETAMRRIAIGGFLFGIAFHGLYFCWFFDLHPVTWLGFSNIGSWAITVAGWGLLTLEGGLLCALLMAAFKWLNARPNPWIALAGFPLLWVMVFSLQNYSPLTLPWALLEYTQTQVPTARLLMTLIGGSGLACGLVFHNLFWEAWLSDRLPKHAPGQRNGPLPSGWLLALVTPFLFFVGGLFPEHTPPVRLPLPVAVVQGNLPIETVRSLDLTEEVVNKAYIQPLLARKLPANTLVVLPEEGAAPGWVDAEKPLSNPLLARYAMLAREHAQWIAVGVSLLEGEHRYNAIALLGPGTQDVPVQFYRKRKLVPFGEETPFGAGPALTGLLSNIGIDYATPFHPATGGDLLHAGGVRIGGLICFELVDADPLVHGFAGLAKRGGADMLVNASNLGWFHDNAFLEAQFLAIGQARAAETQLPVIIAGNSGVSAVIDPTGAVLMKSNRNVARRHQPEVLFYPQPPLVNRKPMVWDP